MSGRKLDFKKIRRLLELGMSQEFAAHHGWAAKKILSSSLYFACFGIFYVNFCYISG